MAAIACFAFGYAWATPKKLRKLKCWIGLHAPDAGIREEGMYLVQRCLYCDRVTMKMEKRENTLRRIL